MYRKDKKRKKEQRILEEMIGIYCRNKHGTKEMLCDDCKNLLAYAKVRSEKCPFMDEKTFCSNCKVHCYRPEQRKRIKEVMRYAGPRMLLVHPCMAISHVIQTKREKKRLEREE